MLFLADRAHRIGQSDVKMGKELQASTDSFLMIMADPSICGMELSINTNPIYAAWNLQPKALQHIIKRFKHYEI